MGGRRLTLNSCSKSVGWYLFIGVIVLKNIADSADRLDVFIPLVVLTMQRIMLSRVPVGQSKVYSDVEIDLTPSEDVL